MVAGVSSASNLTKNTPEPRSCLTAFACKKIYVFILSIGMLFVVKQLMFY